MHWSANMSRRSRRRAPVTIGSPAKAATKLTKAKFRLSRLRGNERTSSVPETRSALMHRLSAVDVDGLAGDEIAGS